MRVLEKIIAFVSPHDCLVCGDEGDLICAWCAPDACPTLPDRCYMCLKVTPASRMCPSCRRASRLRHVWAATAYEGTAKQLIYKLKFGRAQSAATVAAGYLDSRLPYLTPNTIITAVPAATGRMRVRGYDQAALIAISFARQRGLTYSRLLLRTDQQRQVGAGRLKRIAQLTDSFRPVNQQLIGSAPILLIDDVLTTGATLESAAKTLRRAGAKNVSGAVFAHAAAKNY